MLSSIPPISGPPGDPVSLPITPTPQMTSHMVLANQPEDYCCSPCLKNPAKIKDEGSVTWSSAASREKIN